MLIPLLWNVPVMTPRLFAGRHVSIGASRIVRWAHAASVAVTLAACASGLDAGEGSVSPPALQPPTMTVAPESLVLSVGEVGTFAARLSHFEGDTVVLWSSTSDSVASVGSTGEVRALRFGSANIVATSRARSSLAVTRRVIVR
jgi:hypothetical protein